MHQGDFLLDPEVAYLNHGSYGACPRPVFEEYQRLQLELEREPTDYFTRRVFTSFWGSGQRHGELDEARAALAAFLGARADDLVFVPNATTGLNAVLRSLDAGRPTISAGSRMLRTRSTTPAPGRASTSATRRWKGLGSGRRSDVTSPPTCFARQKQ